ncbi:hypothetical protein C7974DRAFT_384325, partial [Boeremia exigua]|uniref:uncharacterized protein n=1 Tax=Boeremia exigua TaxID=749465 RepID=UPI001E8CAFC0
MRLLACIRITTWSRTWAGCPYPRLTTREPCSTGLTASDCPTDGAITCAMPGALPTRQDLSAGGSTGRCVHGQYLFHFDKS